MFKEQFSFQRLNHFFSIIYKIIMVQIVLTIFNLPLAFSNLFIVISQETILVYILFTVTLLPSLVACFTALRQLQSKDFVAKIFIIKFWQSYIRDIKQNFVFSLIYTILFEIFAFDFFYVKQIYSLKWILIVIFLTIFILLMLYLTTAIVLSYFKLSFIDVIKDAIYLCMSRFLNVTSSVFLCGGLFVLTKLTSWGVLHLTFGGISVVYLFFVLGKVLELEAKK